MNYESLIVSESEKIRQLNKNIDITFLERDKGPKQRELWSRACAESRNYRSLLIDKIERIYKEKKYCDVELIEFSIRFLELDARFFRSGYIKEEILRKISRSNLKKRQLERLSSILIDAVRKRGGREFRRYCRLSTVIQNEELKREINELRKLRNTVGSRAKMMGMYMEYPDNET